MFESLRENVDSVVEDGKIQRWRDEIRTSLGPDQWNLWLEDAVCGLEGTRLTIVLRSQTRFVWVQSHYESMMRILWAEIAGGDASFQLVHRNAETPSNSDPKAPAANSDGFPARTATAAVRTDGQEFGSQSPLFQTQWNFARYLEHDGNKQTLQLTRKILERPGALNPFYVFGGPGSGKTHLLHAIGNELTRQAGCKVGLVDPTTFLQQYRESLQKKDDRTFYQRYRTLDVLLFDDIQSFSGKLATSVEFFHLFNHLAERGKQMILTSDVLPADLADLDIRIKSRFSGGIISELAYATAPSRALLFQKFAQRMDMALSESVARFLADQVSGDLREIQGILNSLAVQSAARADEGVAFADITEDFCRSVLGRRIQAPTWKESPERSLAKIAEHAGLTVDELLSTARSARLLLPRQMAVWVLRQRHLKSLADIGRMMSGRSASTVSELEKSFQSKWQDDLYLQKVVQDLFPTPPGQQESVRRAPKETS